MRMVLKIIGESARLAIGQLSGNRLRSFLSLLGITIGIFCIISVFSGVESLEHNVRSSFDKLGNDIIFVEKFSWSDSFEKWWKYIKRPNPSFEDYLMVKEKVKSASDVSFHIAVGFTTLKYKSNNAQNVIIIGTTADFLDMFAAEIDKGRNLTAGEFSSGANKVVLGYKVADALFGSLDPLGKTIKMKGRKYKVTGIIAKAGDDIINVADFDDAVLVSAASAKSMINFKSRYVLKSSINIKAAEGNTIEDLKDEVTGVIRANHRLRPREDDDFSLNEMSMLTSILDGVFVILNAVGFIIGIFAIIVGMFSVANIMFVSVKERTPLIGVKKALGAKHYVILLEFLIESVVLCILGGLIGLALVYMVTILLTNVAGFPIFLSWNKIFIGVGLSLLVGILSGIIPAYLASKMDPVEAIRA